MSTFLALRSPNSIDPLTPIYNLHGSKQGMQGGNRFPLAFTALQNSISLSTDVSGIPALTIGPNNQVYFAAAMKGTYTAPFAPPAPFPNPGFVTTATPTGSTFLYNIVVGNFTSDGTNLNVPTSFGPQPYYPFFNSANLDDTSSVLSSTPRGTPAYQLQGTTDDDSPSIAVGPDLEMYIAYVTQSQIPQRTNMADTPTFCGCVNRGVRDIVVARLTNLGYTNTGSSPTPGGGNNILTAADWRLQDATLNSCADETGPKLAIDRTNRFLYMVHQTNYQILCYTVTGTDPNIILSCFDLVAGTVVWREAQGGVNGSGQTRAPAIAVDTRGGICVAAEITGPMTGGRDLSGAAVGVDVVKFNQISTRPGVYGSRTRAWVLSQFVSLNPLQTGARNTQPTIACDPTTGAILLAFVSTGTLPGQSRSVAAGATDLVVVTMKSDGSSVRVQQGGVFNPLMRPYQSASAPYATADPYGNFYLSVSIVEATAPYNNNVLVFKLLKNGDLAWSYQHGAYRSDAYALAGDDAPNSIFPTDTAEFYPAKAVYSQTPIAVGTNLICTATVTNNAQDVAPRDTGFPGSNGLAVGYFKEALYYLDETAFNYMAVIKNICACGVNDCGC